MEVDKQKIVDHRLSSNSAQTVASTRRSSDIENVHDQSTLLNIKVQTMQSSKLESLFMLTGTRLNHAVSLLKRSPFRSTWLRRQSTKPPTSTTATPTSRFDRVIARTPTKFLRTRLQVLKNAPLTTITSFLLLHEITAVVPLFGLAGAFHYYQWLPPFFAEGEWVLKGVKLFGNYFRRKGWISSADAANAHNAAEQGRAEDVQRGSTRKTAVGKWFDRGEGGTRIVVEFATAYAVVKALLPLRIVVSVWGAPWFARYSVVPMQKLFKRMFSKKKTGPAAISNSK